MFQKVFTHSSYFQVNSSEANLWQVGLTVQNLTMADVNVTYRLLINNTIGPLVGVYLTTCRKKNKCRTELQSPAL